MDEFNYKQSFDNIIIKMIDLIQRNVCTKIIWHKWHKNCLKSANPIHPQI